MPDSERGMEGLVELAKAMRGSEHQQANGCRLRVLSHSCLHDARRVRTRACGALDAPTRTPRSRVDSSAAVERAGQQSRPTEAPRMETGLETSTGSSAQSWSRGTAIARTHAHSGRGMADRSDVRHHAPDAAVR